MSTQVQNNIMLLHPILREICLRIQSDVIIKHNMPIRLFETGRSQERHQHLLNKGRTTNIYSKHLYNLKDESNMLYAAAVDFVFYDKKWSWNLRDQTVFSWYFVFGNTVLDNFPQLEWHGTSRKSVNYTHFQLRDEIIVEHMDKYPCVLHP